MKQQDKYQKKIKKLPWLLYKNSTYSLFVIWKKKKKINDNIKGPLAHWTNSVLQGVSGL